MSKKATRKPPKKSAKKTARKTVKYAKKTETKTTKRYRAPQHKKAKTTRRFFNSEAMQSISFDSLLHGVRRKYKTPSISQRFL